MAQIATTIWIDSELKKEFDLLCEEYGISMETVFNLFVKDVVKHQRLPFCIEGEPTNPSEKGMLAFMQLREQAKDLPEITLEEINEEISAYRASKYEQKLHLCSD